MKSTESHPYYGKSSALSQSRTAEVILDLNRERPESAEDAVLVTYYLETTRSAGHGTGLEHAAKMIIEHGTAKPWAHAAPAGWSKPDGYDNNLSVVTDFELFAEDNGTDRGLITIAYPSDFFDKRTDDRFPLAQFMTAVASEPFVAFSFLRSARITRIELPERLSRRLPGPVWPHRRIRSYLGLSDEEPLIGTIVKPKTGLTPSMFAESIAEAAEAGVRFAKADENLHLTVEELRDFVAATVGMLGARGFDLGRSEKPKGVRFLFAPHITADYDLLDSYAETAVRAGANALMFSPHYAGGFLKMSEIASRFDVPVYAHTAGMNVYTGSPNWGIDPSVIYQFAAGFGASFMQITTMGGYLRPFDSEKPAIIETLRRCGYEGIDGMTLAIAGGLNAENVGENLRELGGSGRMLLAGSSIYEHPKGIRAGVEAIKTAIRDFHENGAEKPAN